MTELLTQGLLKWNITLSDKQLDQFMQYYKLLVDKNKVMNLTAITEYNEVVQKHFLDSLSLILAPVFGERKCDRCGNRSWISGDSA